MPEIVHDEVTFFVEEQGDGPPLVLLHGFTGSSQTWSPVSEMLVQHHHVVAIDIIGHGRSDAPVTPDRYSFERVLHDLASIVNTLGIPRAAWLGYSMGGRLALGLALRHPHRVTSLILESASPGIADSTDRAARRAADDLLATRIEAQGIEAFVDAWERLPLWTSQQRLPTRPRAAQREIRLSNRAPGLAGSLRGMGAGTQPSLWDRLHEIDMPVYIIAGELDEKFSSIARNMHTAMPASQLEIVADAGHAVHLEQPTTYARLVTHFLKQTDRSAPGAIKEG